MASIMKTLVMKLPVAHKILHCCRNLMALCNSTINHSISDNEIIHLIADHTSQLPWSPQGIIGLGGGAVVVVQLVKVAFVWSVKAADSAAARPMAVWTGLSSLMKQVICTVIGPSFSLFFLFSLYLSQFIITCFSPNFNSDSILVQFSVLFNFCFHL